MFNLRKYLYRSKTVKRIRLADLSENLPGLLCIMIPRGKVGESLLVEAS